MLKPIKEVKIGTIDEEKIITDNIEHFSRIEDLEVINFFINFFSSQEQDYRTQT